MRVCSAGLGIALCSAVTRLPAQQSAASTTVTREYRLALVNRLADELAAGYVVPDVGAAMARRIRDALNQGRYDSLDTPPRLVAALTGDLRAVSHDRHLNVVTRDPLPAAAPTDASPDRGAMPAPAPSVTDARRLAGNIGYVRIDRFGDSAAIASELDSAMKHVYSTDALILDLRQNHGGSADGMRYLAGFFFRIPTLIGRIYSRQGDVTTDLRTAAVTVGLPYLGRPLYVLTGRRTASAGEAAAYHLKYAAHAVVVGDTTSGAAHRTRPVILNEQYTLTLPYTRVINLVSGGDWEGTGVIPDIATPADSALEVAHAEALRRAPPTSEHLAALSALGAGRYPIPPAGKIEARTLYDSSYHRLRDLWIYTPPGYDPHRVEPYPMIVAFDGREYLDEMPLPRILDALLANHRAPAFVAVLVDDSTGGVRIADLGNAARMPEFLARQLLPYVRRGWHVTTDPHRAIVTGSSAGGIGSAYVAFMRPDLFGNVWSQSGAFWRGAEASNDPPYEWLTQRVKSAPKKDIRFYLDVGELEDHPTLGGSGPDFRDANRRFHDALVAKGYDVVYTEVPGATHDGRWWGQRLGDGIVALSGGWTGSVR